MHIIPLPLKRIFESDESVLDTQRAFCDQFTFIFL